jgi:excisionase family DNA binding protein
MHTIEKNDRLLKMAEVTQMIGYSEQHVRALVKRGQIPGFKLQGRWRFHEREILEWIEAAQKGEVK